ncbi:acyl-acyl carrier protein thioesterase ATL4, chloroplastic-like [Panicum virgatum]|uniref:acyl-acyl carrier protein thioesterase ATL4, chloroplastic-like n=1 Tax=Panicum virgatum TaxID=38727 RepID=UPI0019D58AB8|nr:acyl-acyl carrier protein thioesterase ATL4, chloroplastic-like [Panicum virgatum]
MIELADGSSRGAIMEFCAQQRFNPPPPSTKQPPARAPAAWPRSGHPYTAGRRSSSRDPSRALQVTATRSARPGRPSEVVCVKNNIQDTKLPRAGKFFELEMTVRDCDLDKYGVVNNAVYAAYIETARQEMIARLGVRTASIARAGRAMAVSELNVKYFAPLKRGAKFVVMVRVVGIKGVRMLMEHLITTLPERKLMLEAMATVVCLNEDYRPTRMFPEMANLLHFFSQSSQL